MGPVPSAWGTPGPAAVLSLLLSLTYCFGNRGAKTPHDRQSHHAGQSPAQALPGHGGAQASSGNDAVNLPGSSGNTHNQEHPGQNPFAGGHPPHG